MNTRANQQFGTIPALGGRSAPVLAPRPSPDAAVSKPSTILVVEDQDDVRRMVATALEIEGYSVTEAANAHEGLAQLHRRRFDLLLSDYAMPGGTGTWMIQEATRLGLMNGTPAMIVTAHPDVRDLSNIAVINKPLDLDDFLDQVRKVLLSTPGLMARAVPSGGVAGDRIELVLYVSSTSDASIQARVNLERVLARFDRSRVQCRIVDLVKDPFAGDADRIAFTPTLVKHHPTPRTWVLGNLRHDAVLTELLESSGIGPAE